MTEHVKIILASSKSDEEKARVISDMGYGNGWVEVYLSKFLSISPVIESLKVNVRILSQVPDPVLIYGASGTGKMLIAKALHGHRCSNEKSLKDGQWSNTYPFIHINCAGLPDTLFESELFGHEKGSFTGASTSKEGLLSYAGKGTVFLDEIAEMPMASQAKLLTALQEKVIRPVGSNDEVPISCRILCATHHNIKESIRLGEFRHDLYYRLGVFELTIPSLVERGEEEIQHIVTTLCPNFPLKTITSEDLEGNVRSLQHMIRRWQVLGE